MPRYGKIGEEPCFEVREKTLKTWEKTRLYQEIRRYEKYDKSAFSVPWKHGG